MTVEKTIIMDYSIKIGGEAGQGIQTVGDTLAKVFSRTGFHVFTNQDYESRVRGGHNFYQIRFSDKPIMASREKVDILVALDKESIERHGNELSAIGQIIYDSTAVGIPTPNPQRPVLNHLDVPFIKLAVESGGSKIMANTVATGAVLGMLGMDIDILIAIIKDTFKKKGEQVIDSNISAAMAGHDFAVKNCIKCSFSLVTATGSSLKTRMLINGVEAIASGAIASGCKFYSAYPMTPSTGIMNYIADKEKEFGIIVEQAEDEIAAINMVLGASFAGVRAMTGTAGGGFALMVEGLSLSGMTETPVVIALGQRPAPATGFPTRTEQGDLLFALHTAHGEFPRIIFAPGTPEQAFYLTNKAFELAEKYQVPAIIIFDQYLADSEWTFESFDLGRIRYTDYRLRAGAFKNLKDYKRHAFTDTGVSPMGVPGDAKHLVVTDSDEHDEEGHIVEDAETRIKMVDKRLFKKLPLIREEMETPLLYGDNNPEVVITGWGSNYGAMKEAVDELLKTNRIAMLHFSEIYPFPVTGRFDYLNILGSAKKTICIENNATGQFARTMKAETGYVFDKVINKYDGRPFTIDSILREVLCHL
jgi:2-oxoglutarate ferredoxin oxidoreductase subunit alpha